MRVINRAAKTKLEKKTNFDKLNTFYDQDQIQNHNRRGFK